MTDTFSETGLERLVDRELDERMKALKDAAAARGRKVEDTALYVALAIAGLYGLAGAIVFVAISLGLVTPKTVPWTILAIPLVLFLGCILPKTVGRATAGKIWTGLGAAAAKRIEGGK